MSRILSATSTESATKLHRALATESEAETLSRSFQSSSSPTMHRASVSVAEQSFMEDTVT